MLDTLSVHGERFLKLFEDADSVPSRLKVRKINQTVGDAMQGIPQTSQITGKKGPLALVGLDSPSTLKKTSQSLSLKRPLNEIEEIIFTHGSRQPKVSAASTSGYRQAGIHPHQPQPSSTMDMKAERRAFMSHKASKIHSGPGQDNNKKPSPVYVGHDQAATELDPLLSSEEFKKLQLEVERLGGKALDKKQRKAWQAQVLERLGARPDKLPRCSAKIGQGMAKKKAERESRALQEAIAAGTVRVKGQGRKRQAEKVKNRDWGLQEAGVNFKGGVLKVKSPAAKDKTRGK